MGEELVHRTEGEVGGAAQSSLLIVVQSFFEQLPSRGPLVNAHFGLGAWTQTAQPSATGRLVLCAAGACG